MTLEEAIRFNQALERDIRAKGMVSFADALKLGIEALKFTLAVRGTILHYATLPLPGETED